MALTAFAGLFPAAQFAYGTSISDAPALQVTQGSTATGAYTIVCSPPSPASGGGTVIPVTVNTPITIGSDSGFETVTPTAVSTDNLGRLLITATFTYAHGTGAQVRSGSYGVQEAAEYAKARGGGLVVLSPAWFAAQGSHAAGLTALVALKSLATNTYTVLDYSGVTGSKSYTAASGSVYASTAFTLY